MAASAVTVVWRSEGTERFTRHDAFACISAAVPPTAAFQSSTRGFRQWTLF